MDKPCNAAESLSQAAQHYDILVESLGAIADEISSKVSDKSFSKSHFLHQFDVLLQLVLFETCISDGNFCENEALSIEALPQEGDLLAFLKSDNPDLKDVTWKSLIHGERSELADFSAMAQKKSEEIIEEFFLPLAFIDYTLGEEKSFLLVARGLRAIAYDIAGVDGLDQNSERIAAFQAIIAIARKAYAKAANDLKAH
jgi:hypothetical protein